MANMDIRNLLFQNNIKHFTLAKELGVCESTLSRWLRAELPPGKKDEVLEAVKKLIAKQA